MSNAAPASQPKSPAADPPQLAERLLARFLPPGIVGSSILGDLREEFQLQARSRTAISNRFWYWLQTLIVGLPYALQSGGSSPGSPHRRFTSKGAIMLESILQDLRYALRTLARNPGFTLVAMITLALGIGATTAIFSVADAALFQAPPVREPERLATIYTTCRRGDPRCSSSYPDYEDYRRRSRAFEDMAAYSWLPISLGGESAQARQAAAQLVTGNYFSLLGLSPFQGRLIQPSDHQRGEVSSVVVLAHDLWSGPLGGDAGIVGQTMRLNGVPFTVIGIAPPGFQGTGLGDQVELWIPMFSATQLNFGAVSDPAIWDERGSRWIDGLTGRLAEGATVEQARSEMLAISEQLRQEDPRARGPRSVTVDAASTYRLPVRSRSEIVQFVALLAGVVGFTLLLACANLANLLLARAAARGRETGVRLCLGAKRSRLLRQLMTESLLLSLLGGLAGLLVAHWMIGLLASFELPGGVSIESLRVSLDLRLLLFALAISAFTGVIFGTVPALQATRLDLVSSLKEGFRSSRSSSPRLRKALLAVQIALCLVLLVGSGLFLRTLYNGLSFDMGFPVQNLALARFNLSLLRYSPEQASGFVEELRQRAQGRIGVLSTAVATRVPLQLGGATGTFARVAGYQPAADEEMRVDHLHITPDYFRTLGLKLVKGREFSQQDRPGSPRVVVINQEMARLYWKDGKALGGSISLGNNEFEVVGVARNTNWRTLQDNQTSFVYLPLAQSPNQAASRFLTLALRTKTPAESVFPVLLQDFQQLDPNLALNSLQSMQSQLERVLMPQRMGAFLLTGFGLLALTLAAVGVYGVVSYSVSQGRREIGIRMALGAGRTTVLRSVLAKTFPPLATGLLVGLVSALLLSRSIESFLFGVPAQDPLTLSSIGLGLGGIAFLATLIPARRAMLVDPVEVLRTE